MSFLFEVIHRELDAAKAKFPDWPNDPFHALAVAQEEAGEVSKALLDHVYATGESSIADIQAEAIQAAAMFIRFAENLENYNYKEAYEKHN